jgi:hypothetical protein
MTSNTSTADEAYFRPSGSWWTGDDAPDHEDMQEEELEYMQDQEAERMEENLPPPSPLPERDVMDDAPIRNEELRVDPMSIDLDNPSVNTYEMVKARFEISNFKVRKPFSYARIDSTDEPCLHTHIDLQHYYCDWKYWGMNKKGDIEKMSFISAWLDDNKKRVVDRIVMDPTKRMKSVYNMWRGFTAENLPPVNNESLADLIKPIIKHIDDVITAGVKEHTDWILDYLANIIQRPANKTQVAISLYGTQRCGKGIIFEFFRHKVLGKHCSFQTPKPERDLFGRFATGALGCVCLQVDEVKSLHDHADQLKDFITNPTLNIEKKGKDVFVVDNLVNLILTSNNANALTVSADDGRFALFHCSSVHKGNAVYFKELGNHLDQPEVARAFYQHLLSRDLSAYPNSFQHSRPITEYYRDAQHNSMPVISRFISALVNSSYPVEHISGREMYKQYVQFHQNGNYRILMTESSFGRDIKKIAGIEKKRSNTGMVYTLSHKKIKQYLESVNEYDEDAEYH